MDIFEKGYANFTFNYFDQKRSQRAGTITRAADEAAYWGVEQDLTSFVQRNPSAGFQVGLPDMKITNFVYNMGYTLDEETETEIYSFGTLIQRSGSAPQFARCLTGSRDLCRFIPEPISFCPKCSPNSRSHFLFWYENGVQQLEL